MKVLTINSASDAQLIVKTCLDETALTCFNQQTGKYSLAQLKNITEVVTTVYERTGVKLTAAEVSKGIEELGETDEVGTAVENVVRYHNLKKVDTGTLKVIEIRTPEIANSEWIERGYGKPPYNLEFEVKIVQAGNEEYVRVFSYNSDGTSNKLGGGL